jgi:hypothetical protein
MNSRLTSTPDNKLVTAIQQLETEVAALKATQLLGGSSVMGFSSDTGAAYDWSGNTPSSGDPIVFLLVTATAVTSPVLYAYVVTQLFVGTSSSWYRPDSALADQAAGKTPFEASPIAVPASGGTNQNQWVVAIQGDPTKTVYAKFYVPALDKVTITVAVV